MAKIFNMKKDDKLNQAQKQWLEEIRKSLLNKYFELLFEQRHANRILLVDVNRRIGQQQISIGEYVNLLKKDIKHIEEKIGLADEMINELIIEKAV